MRQEVKNHGSPSTPIARITKLEVALKEEEKQCQDASESVVKMTPREEEDR